MNRLPFGGGAPPTLSQFPDFEDGDVHLIISGARQYQLHSNVLRISPTLRKLLKDENAAKLSSHAVRDGVKIRFRLQRVQDAERGYVLESIPLNERGRAIDAPPIPLDLENGRTVDELFPAYHAVLGAFYQIQMVLDESNSDGLTDILKTASKILDVAEYLDCVTVVTRPIEATLLSTGQILHVSMVNSPASWLSYAFRLKSRVLFREALIHAAGQYYMPSVQDNLAYMEPEVHATLKKKADVLKEAMKQAIRRILTYYPTHIQREKTVGRADKDSIGRASYANDIMTWIALVVLRHWFAQNVAEDQTHHAPDMGKEMVDYIMAGGEKYLNKVELEEFHRFFPMSVKANNVLESKLADMKEHIKMFVVDLTKNESQLDNHRTPNKHFLCTKMEMEDYPWEPSAAAKRPIPADESDDEDEDMGDADADVESMSE